jgi:SAM-dependent methyltransferase
MPSFRHRSARLELMDDPRADSAELRRNLDELEFINTYLSGYAPTIAALNRLRRAKILAYNFRFVDCGSGGGDTLRAVARWARTWNYRPELIGLDLQPVMIDYAERHSRTYPEIRYVQADIRSAALGGLRPDIVSSSLFCHHFDDASLVEMLRAMAAAEPWAVLVNDLDRHPLAYYGIRVLTGLFSRSRYVRHDAPLSVLRGRTRTEWHAILSQAGLGAAQMQWHWAWRWEILWQHPRISEVTGQYDSQGFVR